MPSMSQRTLTGTVDGYVGELREGSDRCRMTPPMVSSSVAPPPPKTRSIRPWLVERGGSACRT